MSDTYNALTVVLEKDLSEIDVESLENAIKMFRGVLSVSCHVADIHADIAIQRTRSELGQKILDVIYPKGDPKR